MPSLLPDFEYDIFISYRHKDNRSEKWVSQFVQSLREELEGTFKESISIYFDENPYDGLLENHSVDQSLNNKLKSIILIPIVSQTYSDPRSYAWQHEFCAFNTIALEDKIGRDIRLGNGNVASRILPITIHEITREDIDQIEAELQANFRFIDFTYRAPGVNRPLRQDDKREDNMGRLVYRDQMNKVANALKEIIQGIQSPEKPGYAGIPTGDEDSTYLKGNSTSTKTEEANEKSIAVLPFVSLAQDASQEYFADGMTENILMQLAGIRELKVISRTSVMRYKKTDKLAPEIAAELGVKYILEGSAQSHNNKVRINVQLIDAKKDDPIWSKVFLESMDDIFSIQDKVAEVVAQQLKSSISPTEKSHQKPTENLEAYDLFLKGRYAFNQWNVEGYQIASDYFKKALALDPEFKQAYSYLASSYSARMSWNGDLSPSEALPLISQYLDEAWKRGASDNDYLTKAFIEFFVNKDFTKTEALLLKAKELSPNNANVLYTYSYLLCMAGRLNEASTAINEAKLIEPHSVAYFNYQGIYLYLSQNYKEAVSLFEEGMKLFPKVVRFSDHLGRIFITMGHFEKAREVLEAGLEDSNTRHPSMLAYLAVAHWGLNEKAKSDQLLEELLQRSSNNEKGVNFYLSHVYCARQDYDQAAKAITKATETNDIDLIWLDIDPLLSTLKEESKNVVDYSGAEHFITEKLKAEMPSHLTYHNLDHINDVLVSALRIAEAEKISEEETKLLRIAALYHDAGFISTYKGHEAQGCLLAKETLPPFGFTTQHLEAICSMIMATKIPQTPQNKLDKILCDADLDYLGRHDFYEIGDRLYNEMKDQGFIETEREWNLTQKVFLENHRYHTQYGKSHREDEKQKHLTEVIAKLKR
ncbi:MAG: HD domain-containing protein [Cyclobacteriaceae bacterium]